MVEPLVKGVGLLGLHGKPPPASHRLREGCQAAGGVTWESLAGSPQVGGRRSLNDHSGDRMLSLEADVPVLAQFKHMSLRSTAALMSVAGCPVLALPGRLDLDWPGQRDLSLPEAVSMSSSCC